MLKRKYDVFISYRRKGGIETAKHLNDLLVRDGYRVSFDIDTLRSGIFDTQLYSRIDQCKDFIVIVDPHTFDRTLDQSVKPEEDWLRSELAYALQKGKNVIPVFLDGVTGFPAGLPEDIAPVTRMNGPRFDLYFFDEFYRILKKRFLHPSRRIRYSYLTAGALLVAGVLSYFVFTKDDIPNNVIDESRRVVVSADEHPATDDQEEKTLRGNLETTSATETDTDIHGPKKEQSPSTPSGDAYGVPPAPKFTEARFESNPVDFEDTSLGYYKADKSPMVGYIISTEDLSDRLIEVLVQEEDTRARTKFYVDREDMSNADASWLPYVLIPGNKVRIEFYYSGNGGYQEVLSMENLRRD